MDSHIHVKKTIYLKNILLLLSFFIWISVGIFFIEYGLSFFIERSRYIVYYFSAALVAGILLNIILCNKVSNHIHNVYNNNNQNVLYGFFKNSFYITLVLSLFFIIKNANIIRGIFLNIISIGIGITFVISSLRLIYYSLIKKLIKKNHEKK